MEEARQETQDKINAIKSTSLVVADVLRPVWEQLDTLNLDDDD
jgi:hypothetical protein